LYIFMHLAGQSNIENKRIRVLKLLAIKAACFLKWNLSLLEKRYVLLHLALLHLLQLSLSMQRPLNYSDILETVM